MESGSVPVETRINAIVDYEVKKLSKKVIARKYGVCESTVRGWMHTRDYFVNKCLEIARINEEGKLTVYCRIANINLKNYYDFLKQKDELEDDEILEFIKKNALLSTVRRNRSVDNF